MVSFRALFRLSELIPAGHVEASLEPVESAAETREAQFFGQTGLTPPRAVATMTIFPCSKLREGFGYWRWFHGIP
jgi:hypothetical protein